MGDEQYDPVALRPLWPLRNLKPARPQGVNDMKQESSRRAFLGTTAALGAGGLAGLTSAASAQDAVKPDTGNPGDGGFGRQVSQLPPGRPGAYHDPKDVGEMPD